MYTEPINPVNFGCILAHDQVTIPQTPEPMKMNAITPDTEPMISPTTECSTDLVSSPSVTTEKGIKLELLKQLTITILHTIYLSIAIKI